MCEIIYTQIVSSFILSMLFIEFGIIFHYYYTCRQSPSRAKRPSKPQRVPLFIQFREHRVTTHRYTRHYTFYYTIQLATLQCLCTFQRIPRYCTLIQLIRHILPHHTRTTLHSVCLGTFQAENTALLHTHTVNCQLSIVNCQQSVNKRHYTHAVNSPLTYAINCQLSNVNGQ